ncbi:bifunctional DNA primase/polymerase [Phytohabitans sp. LJ34]|uniref:bifunctional DNA primase/polymerase n=1 Tax=Phytohabitans sp. LJ34 TaxID=3452217 RepID=UPI003F8A4D9C
MTLLDNALSAARRGWHVFPLRPDDKRPAVKDWETRATCDPARIARCWSAGAYNVGIACGPSGLVVIDLDRPKPDQVAPEVWRIPGVNDGGDTLAVLAERRGQPYPCETYTVTTASGGTHLYWQHPDGPELRNTAGALGWLIDTRAHGGYVVAAGSIVDSNPYTVEWDVDPAPLPGWLADLLTAELRPLPVEEAAPVLLRGAGRRAAYVGAAIDAQRRRIAEAPQGQRNRALYLSAVALGQLAAGGALAEEDVYTALWPAARAAGLTRRETDRTIRSGIKAGAARPRSVAA